MTEGVFPVVLHQDPRFFRLGRGGFFYRVGYAASRVFITRGDDGAAQFNASEFGGNAVMAIGSNLYTPSNKCSPAITETIPQHQPRSTETAPPWRTIAGPERA